MEKPKLIQLVKIGQNQLNMCDEDYRTMLQRLTNKKSATKLTVVELHKVIHELQQKGAKITLFARKKAKPSDYSPATGERPVKSEITHKIRAVWIAMGKAGMLRDSSEKALNIYARKVFKHRSPMLLNVGALDDREATQLLEMLKKWQKRVEKERGNE
ncbi:Mu-like prophage FluMu protein gp16 [Bibersteinia trehalosi USDA-ARS-USMARC-189]|uniref:Mu-like prophage FluMu protein gp16 n=1 Tax=Bibersteinia trehalosi USDA-ARS-USMARC-189 TaxID=1263831 RepID=A0ABM5PAP8_BIBTR|nr:regulatory protein GemA [Bibersteinia trehalosi]AGH38997.1 Mu-like prophage FluMu protein gp16 [Bibersteinia trehalosi USDA-ARS-USMARC-192]AHG83469.1 Mu-like prophage FluMu protein gp16 [Bibersteinia trehalosi USDA-ARS-USMARC-189]